MYNPSFNLTLLVHFLLFQSSFALSCSPPRPLNLLHTFSTAPPQPHHNCTNPGGVLRSTYHPTDLNSCAYYTSISWDVPRWLGAWTAKWCDHTWGPVITQIEISVLIVGSSVELQTRQFNSHGACLSCKKQFDSLSVRRDMKRVCLDHVCSYSLFSIRQG